LGKFGQRAPHKAPSKVIVLIIATARNAVICNSALAVKLVHVIKAATEAALRVSLFRQRREIRGQSF
jgi:hypothetical protein